MKYFLTGATGFVGGRVARQLVEQGHTVVALIRDRAKAQALEELGIELHVGDITDKESMRSPMTGVDGIFHIAGWYKLGVRHQGAGERINVLGTRNVLELMQELDIARGVYTSTLAVNSDTHGKLVDESFHYTGSHLSEYDRTKAAAHEIARDKIAEGLPLTIVMPGAIYGSGDTSSLRTTFVRYLQRELPVIPKQTAFCWSHVEDTAQAHILAMEKGKPSETYIIAGPAHTLTEAMMVAEQITGVPKPTEIPPMFLKLMSVVMGVVEIAIAVPPTFSAESLRVLAGTTYLGDNSKAKQELSYQPRSLETGLAETLMHEMQLLGMS
ncbi:NAD-dependent epimerase/dehydratase family protein [Synechococcus sp. PCC 7336]|uniref:NAD-dependent epimerase/dehydratase family protein n=1 Tax=Synechococcus sp. PCC 7336 TaxID=195250 RepID=UPI000475EA0A|nr:NAD-dependent epimerase/dehydratase family protein [Synechococcus sp. PCC 7336]